MKWVGPGVGREGVWTGSLLYPLTLWKLAALWWWWWWWWCGCVVIRPSAVRVLAAFRPANNGMCRRERIRTWKVERSMPVYTTHVFYSPVNNGSSANGRENEHNEPGKELSCRPTCLVLCNTVTWCFRRIGRRRFSIVIRPRSRICSHLNLYWIELTAPYVKSCYCVVMRMSGYRQLLSQSDPSNIINVHTTRKVGS